MIKHGQSHSRIYKSYMSMKNRCKSNAHCADRYYKRGIKVCNEWNKPEGFISFYDWAIKNGYKDNLTLDRIDNNGNYCPENCRWVTPKQQSNNRENNHLITINGKTKTLSEWHRYSGIPISSIARNEQKGLKNKKILSVKYHRKKSKIAQYDLDGNLIKIWDSQIQIQKSLNLPRNQNIASVCKHQNKTSFGYGWAYYPEDDWKPSKKPYSNEKKLVTIDGETHNYVEWAKILNITRDSFRRICRKFKNDEKKLSEYKKHRLN